ncbi:alanine dehydrogenase [Bacterioplanes sanyensis]|uniref:Alanine dehydrogenase n=1 Tax=Bacterioplanes sanyensis TaxID=1249553 RepID=A0A222FMN1_9GAMM|nr:alanine dehydrogenase [Bacterioplanes sanyensis]ASP39932.1 alanine dehydrogenase [Bacterioplanes sanyensis]
MRVGVPKEIKNHEYRVGLTPNSVRELVTDGHEVVIETEAGAAIGFQDSDYEDSGASIVSDAAAVFSQADMIVKVKEPQAQEVALLEARHTLFTYLHLAPDQELTDSLIKSRATCIAYETVTDAQGRLPLLAPMSEVAGRIAVQAGARSLEMEAGGRGVLLSGAPGVPSGEVLILGGGVVGSNAIRIAVGMGAQVTVLDTSLQTLRLLDQQYGNRIHTRLSTRTAIDEYLPQADLVIGAVLIPGAAAPKLIEAEQLQHMQRGAVIVDVAIDQGGCVATSRPTTHDDPTYVEQGVVHYCVANMPGAVARTATQALNNATLPFVRALASMGPRKAMHADEHLLNGLNVAAGQLCNMEVASSQGRMCADKVSVLVQVR